MLPETVTVNSRKYDQSIRRSWKCEFVRCEGSMLTFIGVFDDDVTHPDLGHIKGGTTSYEYYWLDRWYNIFRFHEPDGTFRNYYCNINMPPTFADGVLDYVDLDIDVIIGSAGDYRVLDELEFEENSHKYQYPDYVRAAAQNALSEVIALIDSRKLPAV
jgi:uncharacterized protein